jgi:cell division protein FtsW
MLTIRKYLKGDGVIWAVILFLSLFSLLAVYSSTGTLAYKYKGGNTLYYFLRHSSYLIFGLAVIFIVHHIPYKIYSRLSQFLLYIIVPLLAFTLFMGTNRNEASRWLTLPGLEITIQTSDFAKLILIMYVARLLSLKQQNIKDYKTAFRPIIISVIVVCGLILPANLSTAVILFVTSLILMFIGRVSLKQIGILTGIGVICFATFLILARYIEFDGRIGTWQSRIENFMTGDEEENFQVEQSKIAIATGGVFGKGPGNSTQRNFLPHPYSDFIYAIIIEEYGILGGLAILFLYLYLFYRAGVIVRRCDRTFPAFLAIGLAISLVFQAMVNMAVAVNLFPVTGQTLPLVSMGGSSILFSSTALGIILSISRYTKKEQHEAAA